MEINVWESFKGVTGFNYVKSWTYRRMYTHIHIYSCLYVYKCVLNFWHTYICMDMCACVVHLCLEEPKNIA